MKLINNELKGKIWVDVRNKVNEYAPYDSPVRNQIKNNFRLWGDDGLFRLKIRNPKLNIRRNLDEIT